MKFDHKVYRLSRVNLYNDKNNKIINTKLTVQIDPFFQIPQHTIATSVGDVQVPVLYKEGDYSIVLFVVKRSKLPELLDGTNMTPAWVMGDRAIVAMVMADFTLCSIKPYRMLSLAIPVVRQQGFQPISPWKEVFSKPDHRHMGFYLTSCPVDSTHMCRVGSEIWGHPKSPANIDFTLKGNKLDCTVQCAHSGHDVMRFAGKGTRFFRIPSLSFTMFSLVKNQLMRSLLNTRGMFNVHLPMGFKLEVSDSDHPLAQQMHYLGLNNRTPLVVLSTEHYQGRFHEGATVEQVLSTQSDVTKSKPSQPYSIDF